MEGLGSRIKQIRGSRNQEEFAKLIGVDRSTVASWEIDRREPDLHTLTQIATLSHVSLDWLSGQSNTSLEQACLYNDPSWLDLISFASDNNVKPENIKSLLHAALSLKG